MRRVTVLALLAALAGCGGGDDRPPEQVARDYVASDDPAKCDDADLGFLERQSRRSGDDAREACRRSVEGAPPPREVTVRSREVRGDRAEVVLEADGQRVRVTLRREDGEWLVAGFG